MLFWIRLWRTFSRTSRRTSFNCLLHFLSGETSGLQSGWYGTTGLESDSKPLAKGTHLHRYYRNWWRDKRETFTALSSLQWRRGNLSQEFPPRVFEIIFPFLSHLDFSQVRSHDQAVSSGEWVSEHFSHYHLNQTHNFDETWTQASHVMSNEGLSTASQSAVIMTVYGRWGGWPPPPPPPEKK